MAADSNAKPFDVQGLRLHIFSPRVQSCCSRSKNGIIVWTRIIDLYGVVEQPALSTPCVAILKTRFAVLYSQ